jgi:magnesium-transporting ATPase (P-type)
MSTCNESKLLVDAKGIVAPSGLPTEAALKVLCEKIGKYDTKRSKISGDVEDYNNYINNQLKKVAVLEFDRDRKAMSVLTRESGSSNNVMYVKGAPDFLLKGTSKIMNANGDVVDFNESARKELL